MPASSSATSTVCTRDAQAEDHGYCGAHGVREAKKIAECGPTERTEPFRDRTHGITTFLDRRDVPADNNGTERDFRLFAQIARRPVGLERPGEARRLNGG